MILDNFCCIGAELQNREVSQYKAPQLFYYRSANSSETMSVMLTAGFFNSIYQRVKVGDLILVYEPMNKQLQYIKITSNLGGVVGFETVAQSTITAEEVPVVPLSPFVSTNLQAMSDEVITKIGQMETEISGKVSANNSTLTGTTTIASADIVATDTDTLVVNTSATINAATLTGATNTESITTTGNHSVSGNITAANITASTSMTVPTPVSDSQAATKKYVDDALAGFGGGYHPDIFTFEWDDKLRNDVQWLRGDTFSWQAGKVYQTAFLHLCKDILMDRAYIIPDTGLGSKFYRYPQNDTDTQFAWSQGFSTLYTDAEFPELGDTIYYMGTVAGVVDEFGFVSSEYIISDLDATKKYYRDADEDDSVNGYYAWSFNSSTHLYTTSVTPSAEDDVYTKSGGTYTVAGEVTEAILSPVANTETIDGHTITYYVGEDSHKIVLADQESTVLDIYNSTGAAWYYIVDITNVRFKLPRINPAREELITLMRAKGNGKSLGIIGKDGNNLIQNSLAHIQNFWLAPGSQASADVGTSATVGSIPVNTYAGVNTDSTKSGIIIDPTDSDTVFSGKKYLYFYVGEFTQSALENTAGLNSDLFNGKADTNLNNTPLLDYIVEQQLPNAGNNYTWYDLYKSGKIVQGGYYTNVQTSAQHSINISLVKEMADTNYHLLTTMDKGNTTNQSSTQYICSAKSVNFTTTTFAVSMDSTSYIKGMYWEVKGMAAS